jgi:SHS2 domain-containing protein
VYRWVDHTAELELAVESSSEEGVFADAVAALGELLGEAPGGATVRFEVAARAPDRAAVLADWISELVFLAETESFVPERVVALSVGDGSARGVVEGRRAEPRQLVKAVTYHGLSFDRVNGGWKATVVLDV